MSEAARTGEGLESSPATVPDERKGPKRAGDPPVTPEDAEAGAWLDGAARVHSDMDAFATMLGVDERYLRKMRLGQKPIAGRHLVHMKGKVEAVLAFVGPLLESIGHVARPVNAPTFLQLSAAVLADLHDGSSVTWALILRSAAKRGWTAEQVALALHPEGQP